MDRRLLRCELFNEWPRAEEDYNDRVGHSTRWYGDAMRDRELLGSLGRTSRQCRLHGYADH